MGHTAEDRSDPGVTGLVEGIVTDAERLLGQQFALFRAEVCEELDRAKAAAASGGAGIGLLAVTGILVTQALVQGLHEASGLPLSACYALVGGAVGAAGVGLLRHAQREASGIQLRVPPRTAQAIRENVAWLKEQTTAARV